MSSRTPKAGVAPCSEPCEAEVIRASGDAVCEVCKKIFYDHPRCPGSYVPGPSEFSGYFDAVVACDGRHLHL